MKAKIKKSDIYKLIREDKINEAAEMLLKVMESSDIVTDSPKKVWEHLRSYGTKKQEHFIVVTLNNKNSVIDSQVLFIGTISESIVHPREIFRKAIEDSASSIIIVHNHPSGVLTPSREDIQVTKRISEVGKIVGIRLLDHIIISGKSFLSLREENFMSDCN